MILDITNANSLHLEDNHIDKYLIDYLSKHQETKKTILIYKPETITELSDVFSSIYKENKHYLKCYCRYDIHFDTSKMSNIYKMTLILLSSKTNAMYDIFITESEQLHLNEDILNSILKDGQIYV